MYSRDVWKNFSYFRGQGQGWGHFFLPTRVQPILSYLYLPPLFLPRRVACARCTARRGRDSNWPVSRPCVSVACRLAFTSIEHVHTDTHAQTDRGVTEAGSRPSALCAPPPAPSPRASNRRTLHTTHNSTAWRLRRHHCRQSSLRRKSVWALPLRRAQSGSRTTRTLCASAPRDSNCGPWPAM